MKGRTFLIMGGVVVVSAVAYAVYKHIQNNNNEECVNSTVDNDIFENASNVSVEIHSTSTVDVYETREAVVHSVKERHSEAAAAMAESLNTVFNEANNDEIVIENSEALNEIGSELDDLLN